MSDYEEIEIAQGDCKTCAGAGVVACKDCDETGIAPPAIQPSELCCHCRRIIAGPTQICAMIAHKYCEPAAVLRELLDPKPMP